jgi:hypothetical protein
VGGREIGPGKSCQFGWQDYIGFVRTVSNAGSSVRWLSFVSLVLFFAGCATTPKVDWTARIGNYTYDQAVIDYGPPDKQAKLDNGVLVAEWMTRRGYHAAYPPYPFLSYGYYHWCYGPWYHHPFYMDTYNAPATFLRMVFSADGKLASYKKFYR